MSDTHGSVGPTVWDSVGAVETVYVRLVPAQVTGDGWWVTSLDVGGWTPLEVGDRLVALDYDDDSGEWLVEVVESDVSISEVFYRLRRLSALEPGAYRRWDRR